MSELSDSIDRIQRSRQKEHEDKRKADRAAIPEDKRCQGYESCPNVAISIITVTDLDGLLLDRVRLCQDCISGVSVSPKNIEV